MRNSVLQLRINELRTYKTMAKITRLSESLITELPMLYVENIVMHTEHFFDEVLQVIAISFITSNFPNKRIDFLSERHQTDDIEWQLKC